MKGRSISDRIRANNAKADWERKRKLTQQLQGPTKTMKDATGRELKRGDIVHIPAAVLPTSMLVAEVVEVAEAGVIKVPGQPPMPAQVMVMAILRVGPGPDGVVPNMYKVGEKQLRPVAEEAAPRTIEGLTVEDPLNTQTKTDTPLESERLPDGVELTDV